MVHVWRKKANKDFCLPKLYGKLRVFAKNLIYYISLNKQVILGKYPKMKKNALDFTNLKRSAHIWPSQYVGLPSDHTF